MLPALRERPRDIEILADHFIAKYAEANGVPVPPVSQGARQILLGHHWRGNVRELENTMHRAVLLARDGQVTEDSIMLTGEMLAPEGSRPAPGAASAVSPAAPGAASTPPARTHEASELVGRTVADVERDLILDTLEHCLGNRTHAANILGISIRTLRNKLKLYGEKGMPITMPGEAERTTA